MHVTCFRDVVFLERDDGDTVPIYGVKYLKTLKLIDGLRAACWMPPDYWQTDNSNGLVMVIRNYHWLNSASQVLISTCSAPLFQTRERKQTHKWTIFDLDLWPTTLTYNPRLAKVKVDPRAKNRGQRSNGSNRRAPTDKRTDAHTHAHTHGRYQTYYLPCYAVDNKVGVNMFCVQANQRKSKVAIIARRQIVSMKFDDRIFRATSAQWINQAGLC